MMSCLGRDVPPGPQPIPPCRGTNEQMENPLKSPTRLGEDPFFIPHSESRPALRRVQGSPEPFVVQGAFRIQITPYPVDKWGGGFYGR